MASVGNCHYDGVVERRNCSILDIVCCILQHAKIPPTLWAEAAKAACLLLNARSTKSALIITAESIVASSIRASNPSSTAITVIRSIRAFFT